VDLVEGRIALVPLVNETGDPSLGDVLEEMEEAAAARAADVSDGEPVLIRGRDEGWAEDSPVAIGVETGAEMVLTGVLTQNGDQLRLDAEILDSRDGSTMHVLPPEISLATSPTSLVNGFAERVAGAAALHLDEDWTSPHLHSVPTLASYRLAKKADTLFAQTLQEEAIPVLYEAYETDTMTLNPLFLAAAAHRNLGRGAVGDSLLDHIQARRERLTEIEGYNLAWFRETPEPAMRAAMAARELDSLGWTYGVGLRANQAGYFQIAAEALSHRKELADAGNYSAQIWPAWRSQYLTALHAIGDHETALAEARLANSDFPDNPWWIWQEMRALAGLGRVDEVLALVDSAFVLLETFPLPNFYETLEDIGTELKVHGYPDEGNGVLERVIIHYREVDNQPQLADALGFAGRTQEAFETLRAILNDESSLAQVGWLGAAAAIIGETGMAEEMLARLQSRPDAEIPNNLRYQAAIHGALQRCDQAIQVYREAIDLGFIFNQAWGGEWWHRDWETEPVRANCPEFQSLLERDEG
jgi:tetratricopeptide (TPR) repeat protein